MSRILWILAVLLSHWRRHPMQLATLLIGLSLTSWFYLRAEQANRRSQQLAATSNAVTAFLTQDLLSSANPYLSADPTIGVLSCLLLNGDRTVQNTARRFQTPSRLLAHTFGLPWSMPRLFAWADSEDLGWDRRTEARDVEWLGGAFMMIRREVIERVGGLDEGFFFYGEDAEFCHRVWKAGWRVRHDPGRTVIHFGGASSDPARLAARQRSTYQWQARYLFQRRCYGPAAEWLARLADLTSGGLRYLKMAARGERQSEKATLQRDMLTLLMQWPRNR